MRKKSRKTRKWKLSPANMRLAVKVIRTVAGTALALIAVTLALTVFFRIDTVGVTGSDRTPAGDLIAVSGIQEGDNLFFVRESTVSSRIVGAFPYVKSIRLRRKLPDTLIIEVTELKADAQIQVSDGWWLLSADGRLLEKTDSPKDSAITVLGCTPSHPVQGETLKTEDSGGSILLRLMGCLADRSLLSGTTGIDLTKNYSITVTYDDRFTVLFGTAEELAYKSEYLQAILPNLAADDKGTIDLSEGTQATFIPGY